MTIAAGAPLAYCPELEELKVSTQRCLNLAALSQVQQKPVSADDAARMEEVRVRLIRHKICPTCSASGPDHFPRLRTAVQRRLLKHE
jgi:hypothetical protein